MEVKVWGLCAVFVWPIKLSVYIYVSHVWQSINPLVIIIRCEGVAIRVL